MFPGGGNGNSKKKDYEEKEIQLAGAELE